jgi:protein involved in polysaccharide export with SLBB domain
VILAHVDDNLDAIRSALRPLDQASGGSREVIVDSGLRYRSGDSVRIRVRQRGRRYDLADDGAAVSRAGRPHGWLDQVDRVVAVQGFNVNRSGVIFVPAVEGRDIAALTLRLADTSRAAYLTLLEAAAEPV